MGWSGDGKRNNLLGLENNSRGITSLKTVVIRLRIENDKYNHNGTQYEPRSGDFNLLPPKEKNKKEDSKCEAKTIS